MAAVKSTERLDHMSEEERPEESPEEESKDTPANTGGVLDDDLLASLSDAMPVDAAATGEDATLESGLADDEALDATREDDDLVARSNDLIEPAQDAIAPEAAGAVPDAEETIDAAVSPGDEPAPADRETADEIVTLGPAELDALAGAMEAGPAEVVEDAPDAGEDFSPQLSDDEITEMVGRGDAPEPQEEAAEAGLGADDLDQLLAEAEAAGALPAAPPESGMPDPASDAGLDALLAGKGDDAQLDNKDPEAPLVNAPDGAGVSLDPDNVSSLLGEAPDAAAAPGAPPPATQESEGVSDDLINALVSAATSPDSAADVGSENLAAAASEGSASGASSAPAETPISQDDLDALIEAAKVQEQVNAAADAPNVRSDDAGATAAVPLPPADVTQGRGKAAPVTAARKASLVVRALVALAAGLAVGAGTFLALHLNRETHPTVETLLAGTANELQLALRIAQRNLDEGSYGLALAVLEGPMDRAPAGPDRVDGEFLQLEARIGAYLRLPDPRRLDTLHADINRLIEEHPDSPRHPDALYWKAQLFLADNLPIAAQDLYDEILDYYPGQQGEDRLLFDAAKLAMRLKQPAKAAGRIQQLINEYPGSTHATEARLLLGDAYAQAGLPEDARTLYMRSMNRAPGAGGRAQAVLRLGRLEFDQERYPQAIEDLDTYLSTTTTTEGSDAVYLLLAQAYRANGELDAARDTLNSLLNFFEPGDVTPQAYLELSHVLDALGERESAVRLATDAVIRYPENPKVLQNAGILHGLNGNPFAAAAALIAADEFGGEDPRLLLTAARHLRTVGLNDESQTTYQMLQKKYTGLPEAVIASAEEAELIFDAGDVEKALDQVDALVIASAGSPEYMTALRTQSDFCQALQLNDKLAETSRAIARAASDDQDLARAARGLLSAGELEEAQGLIARTDLARLRDTGAHALLVQLGEAYLAIDPRRAIDTLEEAYRAYPGERTPGTDISLLKAYTAANRSAAARRMVFEIAAQVQESAVDTPYLIDAAITYGDYLFERKDYRAAADAYAQALDAAASDSGRPISGRERDPDWAKFQRANALLALSDFEGSLSLYAEISNSEAPWAPDAAAKAEYARLEQRLRGTAPAARES